MALLSLQRGKRAACFPLLHRQVGEWMRNVFIKKAICNILLLSLIPTKRNLLSTIFDGPPLSPERETCCMLSICRAFEFLPLYKRIFRFVPAISLDCTVSRIQPGFLLSKDKVLSLLATSLLNRNPYGFPINGSPVF